MLTSDSTNYVMLMTFHCFLLICDSHSHSLLILQKALKENGSGGSSLLASLSPRRKIGCLWSVQKASELGMGPGKMAWWQKRKLGHFPTMSPWQLPCGTALQLWLHCSPMKYSTCQARDCHGFLFQAYIPLTSSPWGIPSFPWGIGRVLFKWKNRGSEVRGED